MRSLRSLCVTITAVWIIIASGVVAVADCITPAIKINGNQGPPRAAVTITGEAFKDGCHDVCVNGVCPPTYPAKGIRILFIQGDQTEVVAMVDADKLFQFKTVVAVPASAKAGPAAFAAETLYENRMWRTRPPVEFLVTEIR